MNQAFFHTDCPSCGAPVQLYSATAVTVVCHYCNSMLIYQDHTLHDTGRDSAILHDFSPIQIGTTGVWQNVPFVVRGRLKAQYDAGQWHEWWLQFDDGSQGWLSEVGDLYAMLRPTKQPAPCPDFADIRAAETLLNVANSTFIASDVREIVLENAQVQGELPFVVPERWRNRVADFRCQQQILTLDYGTEPAEAFLGDMVTLSQLALQNTRDDAQIRQSAGCLRGSRQAENCPHCGASVHWLSDMTQRVICASCHSELDISDGKMQLRNAGRMRDAQQAALPLPLGKTGVLNGKRYTVIGAVYRDELTAQDARNLLEDMPPSNGIVPVSWWREYLLYAPQHGFAWLVETADGAWRLSQTQAAFPAMNAHGEPRNVPFLYDYGGRVAFAAGAFYWQIRQGDVQLYRDYQARQGTLSAEISRNELAWSISTPIAYATLAQAFGLLPKKQRSASASAFTSPDDDTVGKPMRGIAIALFALFNLPQWWQMDSTTLPTSLILSGAIVAILWRM